MAKRFTDSLKYKKKFFRDLPGPYKLLWDFLYHDCDNCGIWIVDFNMAQNYVGLDMPVDMETALKLFNNGEQRIVEIRAGEKWFLPGYIEFQYVQLSEKNRAHIPVIGTLKKLGLLNIDLSLIQNLKEDTGPLQGAKYKAKDKDKEKVKDKEPPEEIVFNPDGVCPDMASIFQIHNPNYPKNQATDYPAVKEIAEKIFEAQKLSGNDFTHTDNRAAILHRWGELVKHIKADPFLSKYSLTQINKHFQSVVQSLNNGNQNGKTRQGGINRAVITGTASGAGSFE